MVMEKYSITLYLPRFNELEVFSGFDKLQIFPVSARGILRKVINGALQAKFNRYRVILKFVAVKFPPSKCSLFLVQY